MPLALAAGSMLDVDAMQLVEAAAAAGFDGVGLRLSAEHAVPDPVALRRRVDELGLVVHDVEVHRIDDTDADPGPLVDAAAAVCATSLLVVSDLADRRPTTHAVAGLVERCAPHGLRVGLEYMAWTDPNTPLDAIEVARTTGCTLVVDVLHHHRVGAGPEELDAIVKAGVLGWLQLCDAPLRSPGGTHDALIHEARHARLPPGDGGLPLHDLVACIDRSAWVSVEAQSDLLLHIAPTERALLLHAASSAHSPSSTG